MSLESQLATHAYAQVRFDAEEADLQATFDAYANFLSIASEYRHAGDYSLPQTTNGQFGYFRRYAGSTQDGRRAAADTKHIYHFGSLTRQAFEAHDLRNLPAEVRRFCNHAEELYWLANLSLRQSLDELSGESMPIRSKPDLQSLFFDEFHPLNIHLRLIGYDKSDDPEGLIAKRHCDRSVFTLHLGDTEPGLEIGFNEDGSDMVPVRCKPGNAPFFAGRGWNRMPAEYRDSYDYIRPANHQVRLKRKYQDIGGNAVRYAAVLFANPFELNTDPPIAETRPEQLQAVAA